MADEKKLVPVFIPPLANILALAERTKGSPLTKAEVDAVRDKSSCIMMESADAQSMVKSRGFLDVNPENCWADWHRLRAQMTGGYLPRIVLCVPGDDEFRRRCEPICAAAGIQHEWRGHDPKMVKSFKVSSMTWPCFSDEDFAWIERHTAVLYVLSKNFTAGEAADVAKAFLKIGRQLLEAGGIGIKCDSSGVSHSRARWEQIEEKMRGTDLERWGALFRAYVALPIAFETDIYSCGMHLLGAPDLIVSKSVISRGIMPGENDIGAAVRLFRIFAIYLLGECPVGAFGSGHTFSVDAQAPRFRLIWEPCKDYEQDSYFFNPFGRWRFTSV